MKAIPYISIKSVLYDLSTMLPETNWNESLFLEWAYKAMRKINLHEKYEHVVCLIPVQDHKAELPSELRYLTQIAYVTQSDLDDTDEIEAYKDIMNLADPKWNPALTWMANPNGLAEKAVLAGQLRRTAWRPMRRSTTPFTLSITKDISLFTTAENVYDNNCQYCEHEYVVEPDMCITTTLKEGLLMVSYLRYPTSTSGDALIPDDEDIKDALLYFILYRYYMKQDIMGVQGAAQRMQNFLSMWQTMKMKAAGKYANDVDTLENIKNHRDRLVPRTHRYDDFFTKLNKKEIEDPNLSTRRYTW